MRDLDLDLLQRELAYDPNTGVFTRRRASGGNPVGSTCGYRHHRGYVHIKVAQRQYTAHRLAWFYVHGTWPTQTIDHINGDKSDNRICNLRDVSTTDNNQNVRKARALSGLIGAHYNRAQNRWVSSISVKGIARPLGSFPTAEAAHEAYVRAKRELHAGNTL